MTVYRSRPVAALALAALAAALSGCQWLDDLTADPAPAAGRIELVQSGGFAGVLRTLTVDVVDQTAYLVRVDDPAAPGWAAGAPRAALRALWQTLEANEGFAARPRQRRLSLRADPDPR